MINKKLKKQLFWAGVRDNFIATIIVVVVVLAVMFALINIFWIIYAFIKYGGRPISEIPAWALFYMFGGRR